MMNRRTVFLFEVGSDGSSFTPKAVIVQSLRRRLLVGRPQPVRLELSLE